MNRVVFSRDWLHHGAWGQRLNLSVNLMSILQNLQNASCDAESLSLAPGRREGGAHSMRQDLATEQQLKELATHSSVLAWRIPGMGEPGGLPSMGSHRVGHD